MPVRKKPPAPVQFEKGATFSLNRFGSPGAHLEPFVNYLEAECGMSANSVKAYRSDLRQFFEWFEQHGPTDVTAVELSHLTAYLKHLHGRQLAATSIARHLVSIKMFFRYLVLEGILQESAVELLSSPKLWQHLPKVLSPDTVDRLLAAPLPADRYPLRDRAILTVMYATGCRASETANLTLADVNLSERFCRCIGKGNKERLVSLNPVAVASIEAYLQYERPDLAKREDPGYLFLSRSGNSLTRISIWHLVKKYAARVGCSREVSPHTLRHSFATHMLAGGAEIRALQELMGHASISTTQIYTHVEHSRLKAVHQRCHPRG